MVHLPDDVVELILGYVTDHQDRNALSLVCRAWYRADQVTRYAVLVCNCYTISPDRVFKRFPKVRSLSIKGRPRLNIAARLSAEWGASAIPWITAAAHACLDLEELQLTRMLIDDQCLMLLMHFLHLRSLSFIACEGFTTVGLSMLSANCRFLRKLDLQDTSVDDGGAPWLNNFAETCTTLETLNFSCLTEPVNPLMLENLVARSPNLRSLRINKIGSVSLLAKVIARSPQLVDLGIGLVTPGADFPPAYERLRHAFRKCRSLRSFSGIFTSSRFCMFVAFPVCRSLTRLDLSYARDLQNTDFIRLMGECKLLEQLRVDCYIGDEGLQTVATYCKKLRELKLFRSGTEAISVTEQGLVALSEGCRLLESLTYRCSKMTNDALVTVANYIPQLTCFRLYIDDPREPDNVTSQPLDAGYCAIVQSCKNLRSLTLSGLVSDQAFLYVGMYAEHLEKFSVASAGDGDNGMIYLLNGCKNLRTIELVDCPFGDFALLSSIGSCEMLQSLWMSSCYVTVGGCKKLAAMMPHLAVEVIRDRNAPNEARRDPFDCDRAERLYVYPNISGPRNDAPPSVSVFAAHHQ